jgi:hypothetical protein
VASVSHWKVIDDMNIPEAMAFSDSDMKVSLDNITNSDSDSVVNIDNKVFMPAMPPNYTLLGM